MRVENTRSMLYYISPHDLLQFLSQVRNEAHTELILLGPGARLKPLQMNWPEELKGRTVYQLSEYMNDLEKHLIDLCSLKSLNLRGNGLRDTGVVALAEKMIQLESLNLEYNNIGNVGTRAIAENLTQLQSLKLYDNNIGDTGTQTIAENLTQLKSLQLWGNKIGEAGAKSIAENLTQLESLNLNVNKIGEAGTKAIAENLIQLKSLDLRSNEIGDAGTKSIAENLTQLKSLDLWSNKIGEAGAKAIAENLIQLESLNLNANKIGETGTKAIAENLTQLKSLNLIDNKIGDAGAKSIAENLTQLKSLDLWSNKIGEIGAKAIAENLIQLESLNLNANKIGEAGAKSIAENLTQLESLDLRSNEIGDAGTKSIAENLTQLKSLDLWSNKIGEVGAKAIAENLIQLESLNLNANKIGVTDTKAIAENLTQLKSLQLWGNKIGEAGAKSIAENLTQLESLNLNVNKIGEAGTKAIAENLIQLKSLDLRSNEIGDAGTKSIAENLTQLKSLDLWNNKIGEAGAKAIAENLIQLESLNLNANKIGVTGTKSIAENLTQLKSLDLWDNKIGEAGAKAIAENLIQLESLNLNANKIGEAGTKAIAENLIQLKSLDLRSNEIGDAGTKSIAENLTQLKSLNLFDNKIGDAGAKSIAENLTQLKSLDLWDNKIGEAGAKAIAENLIQLESLNLNANNIGDEGAKAIAENLAQLKSLDLDSNDIGDDSAYAIAKLLNHLTSLSLKGNSRLISIQQFSNLTKLQYLDISNTGVADLSPLQNLIVDGLTAKWEVYSKEPGLYIKYCPLVHPPSEVASQGHEAIVNYFHEIESQGGVDYLFEAKLLILGEGGAGKTSLIRRLYQPKEPLPKEDETTKGIDVYFFKFSTIDKRIFRLNVWDFGGQHIYHATHQFFLTKNSLYVLVDDTRKDDKSVHDEGFKYWLEVVEVLSDRCPVLIFQNEKGGRSKTIDEAGIKGRFPNVQETHHGNLEKPNAPDQLRLAIEYFVQKLPHIGEPVPKKWIPIRYAVDAVANEKPYISQEDYFDIYSQHLGFDRDKALHLSRYFHDLGVFLHFQDDLRLQKTVILQNRWATEAVFKILDDETVKERFGRFTLEDCRRLWASSEYAEMHLELLSLMEKFELCYLLNDIYEDTWLAPQLLSPSRPEFLLPWLKPTDLILSYRYSFLPKGLVSRLMVRMHHFIKEPNISCWTSGALFTHADTQVLVEATSRGNEILLRSRGPECKALLSVIASALDSINSGFRGLEGKVGQWVPCNCKKCAIAASPEMFEKKRLLQRKRDHQSTIECPDSYEPVSVLELLEGIKLEELPSWAKIPAAVVESESTLDKPEKEEQPSSIKTIKIFLASSDELRDDRDAFDLYFRQQNDQLRGDGLYLQIVRWENSLDAMSDTRLQDEYNEQIRECDVFVSLFMTKTGKYTEEEFNVAHQTFQQHGKPLIYTFFKDSTISTSSANRSTLQSLWAFQDKLKDLGHFYTLYNSVEHLKRQFKDQLENLHRADRL